MASAILALANATAVFDVAGTGVVTDPDTGNVSPAAATVSVEMFLRAETIEITRYPGVDQLDTLYEGYAVVPMAFDSRVQVGSQGTLTFAGEDPVRCEVKALRLPYGNTGLLGETLAAVLGEKVQLISRGQA
jgi:hypothetical protein